MGSGQVVALKNKSLVTKRVTTADLRPDSRPCTSAAEVTVALRPIVAEDDTGGSSGGGNAAGDGDGDGDDVGDACDFGPAACCCAKAKLLLEEKNATRDDNGDNKMKMTRMTSLLPEERDGIFPAAAQPLSPVCCRP
ncbi:hypothetical protein Vafri_15452 [Volvox africanus]|uniref:Uncharacterized protein n=1 Tax=Volvox africanus TaxID=51714 RepID=A0A8J4BLI3_9CHLO|nr:hypothetical protein Vafri_15452 [Volvox africanus]